MSRHPLKALEKADPIARQRGDVHSTTSAERDECRLHHHNPGNFCTGEDQTDAVPSLHDPLAGARGSGRDRRPPALPVFARDLPGVWFCSSGYAFRFFRVCDTGLVELGRDGLPLPEKSPMPKPGMAEAPVARQGIVPASPGNFPGDPLPPDTPSAGPSVGEHDSGEHLSLPGIPSLNRAPFGKQEAFTVILKNTTGFGNPKNCRIHRITLLSTPENANSCPHLAEPTTKAKSALTGPNTTWQTGSLSGIRTEYGGAFLAFDSYFLSVSGRNLRATRFRQTKDEGEITRDFSPELAGICVRNPSSWSIATTSRFRVKSTSRASSLSMDPGWCQMTFFRSSVVSSSTSVPRNFSGSTSPAT